MPKNNKIEKYKKKLAALTSAASNRDRWLNRIAHYATPTLYNFKYNSKNTSNLPDDVYDSEMVQAATEFANLLYSYLSNPASKWVMTTLADTSLLEMPGIKDYLELVDARVAQKLTLSNFYSVLHQAYYSLVAGNCVIYREQKELRYYSLPLSECYYEYDSKNRVNSMYRKLRKTPSQLIEEFPKTVSNKVRDAEKNDPAGIVNCLHIVIPRSQRDVTKKDILNKAYESVYVDLDNNVILSEGGYDKFPYFIGHYLRDPVSPYSYGPAHLCFYDAKSLNQLMLSTLRRAAKEADPPVNIPHDGYILPYLQDPGATNYRITDDPKDKAEFMLPPPASSVVNEVLNVSREKIKRAFFVDLYRSIIDATKRMTTVEVQQRIADRAPMLGPVIWNLTVDFMNYIIEDVIEILLENEELPALPEILQEKHFTLKYLSPLAKAQKVSEFQSLQAFLQFMSGAVNFNQDVVDVPDWDKYVRVAGDATGLPQSIIQEEDIVKKKREERYKSLAAVQQKQEILQGAGALKDAANADKAVAQARK